MEMINIESMSTYIPLDLNFGSKRNGSNDFQIIIILSIAILIIICYGRVFRLTAGLSIILICIFISIQL